jgi:DNA-binding beta-propeller fold protein YncE
VSTNSGISVIDPTGTLVYAAPLGRAEQLAVSPTGPKAGYVYAINDDGTVWEISPYANTSLSIVNTITVGNGPRSLAISPTGTNAGNVYVGDYGNGRVSVIDPSDNRTDIFLSGGFYPTSVAVSPTGANAGYVYVGGYFGDIDVIDPSGNIVGNIGGGFGYKPYSLAVAPTGANAGNIYVGSYGNGTVTVLAPDGTVINTFNVPDVSGIAIAP